MSDQPERRQPPLTERQIRAMGPAGELSLFERMPRWLRAVTVLGLIVLVGVVAVVEVHLMTAAGDWTR